MASWYGQLLLDGLIMSSDLCTGGTYAALFLKLRNTKSAVGMSLQTLITVVSCRTLHLVSHFIGLHYQPAVLPWAAFAVLDVLNATAGICLLFAFVSMYYSTYEKSKDNFGIHFFTKFNLLPTTGKLAESPLVAASFLYSVVLVLAFLWYLVRRSHHPFLTSYFCCFYEVSGAVALIPQLWMFHQDRRVSPLLSYFVVLTAINRVCTLCFWIFYPKVYIWRYPDNRGIQMASEAVNLLILSDFLYYWVRSMLRGDREIILGDDPLV